MKENARRGIDPGCNVGRFFLRSRFSMQAVISAGRGGCTFVVSLLVGSIIGYGWTVMLPRPPVHFVFVDWQ